MSARSLNWLKFGGLVALAFALGLLFAGLLVGTAGLDTIPIAALAAVAAWLTMAAIDDRYPVQPTP